MGSRPGILPLVDELSPLAVLASHPGAGDAPPAALATFAVERLGIFGIFGNEMDSVPDAALVAEPRLSWVVNNAFRWKGKARVSKLLGD